MTCKRVWEAEAIDDGRLDAPSSASFERHLVACADCTLALAALGSMRDAGSRIEPRRSSPLEHRRKRAELLRRANAQALRSPRPSWPLYAVGLLAVVLAVFGFRYQSRSVDGRSAPAGAVAAGLPAFELRPIGTATWHDFSSSASARIALSSGTLAVHVDHLRAGQRFVAVLPDGELEVRGTRFIVEVKDGRTERVLVTEGVVVLRLHGAPARSLTAGESYLPGDAEAQTEASVAPSEPVSRDSSSATQTTKRVVTPRIGSRSARPARASSGLPASLSTVVPPGGGEGGEANPPGSSKPNGTAPDEVAGEAFHVAMAAFAMGSYAEADERFAEFMGRFPGDSRCEDASFLRTVIALRRGDAAGAVARARTYLRRFPRGFRRDEVERMIAAAGESAPLRGR